MQRRTAPCGNRNAWKHGVCSARFRAIVHYLLQTRTGRLFTGTPPGFPLLFAARPGGQVVLFGMCPRLRRRKK